MSLIQLDSIGFRDDLEITGILVDSVSLPVSDKSISIFWNGISIGETITNSAGWFSYSYVPNTLGSFMIEAFFYGDQNFTPSNDNYEITVKDCKTRRPIRHSRHVI